MRILVESGEEPGTGAKAMHPLVIPGLIMGLIRVAHIVIPNHVHNKIIGMINDTYITRYCSRKKNRENR